MNQDLTLILGDRAAGRTSRICELLHAAALGKDEENTPGTPPSRSVLLVADFSTSKYVDRLLIDAEFTNVVSKLIGQAPSLRGQKWAAIGVDVPDGYWTIPLNVEGLRVNYQTVLTQGSLRVIRVQS